MEVKVTKISDGYVTVTGETGEVLTVTKEMFEQAVSLNRIQVVKCFSRDSENKLRALGYEYEKYAGTWYRTSGDSIYIMIPDDTEIVRNELSCLYINCKNIYVSGGRGLKSTEYMFALAEAEYIDLSRMITSNLSNMKSTFSNCRNLKTVNFGNMDTSKVVSMCSMFRDCFRIKEINFGNIDTSNVTDMGSMFYGCSSLEKVNLSCFNTCSLESADWMFSQCTNLKDIDLSSFDTSHVSNMRGLFDRCVNLTHVDLSALNTRNVQNMAFMFRECVNLTHVDLSTFDLSAFDTSNVPNIDRMFKGCTNLESVKFDKIPNKKLVLDSDMFCGCDKLRSLGIKNS